MSSFLSQNSGGKIIFFECHFFLTSNSIFGTAFQAGHSQAWKSQLRCPEMLCHINCLYAKMILSLAQGFFVLCRGVTFTSQTSTIGKYFPHCCWLWGGNLQMQLPQRIMVDSGFVQELHAYLYPSLSDLPSLGNLDHKSINSFYRRRLKFGTSNSTGPVKKRHNLWNLSLISVITSRRPWPSFHCYSWTLLIILTSLVLLRIPGIPRLFIAATHRRLVCIARRLLTVAARTFILLIPRKVRTLSLNGLVTSGQDAWREGIYLRRLKDQYF